MTYKVAHGLELTVEPGSDRNPKFIDLGSLGSNERVNRDMIDMIERFKLRLTDGTGQAKAIDNDGSQSIACDYRTPQGTACLVGLLVTDELYASITDGGKSPVYGAVKTLIDRLAARGEEYKAQQLDYYRVFLQAMQRCHDLDAHWDADAAGKRTVFNNAGRGFFNGAISALGLSANHSGLTYL